MARRVSDTGDTPHPTSDEALSQAIGAGDLERVRDLVEAGANIH